MEIGERNTVLSLDLQEDMDIRTLAAGNATQHEQLVLRTRTESIVAYLYLCLVTST